MRRISNEMRADKRDFLSCRHFLGSVVVCSSTGSFFFDKVQFCRFVIIITCIISRGATNN